MPLPTGPWKAIVSGAETNFVVEAPSPQGQFTGALFGTNIAGFWDESSQKISFTFFVGGAASLEFAVFEGYLFRSPPNPGIGQDVVASLAGTFQMAIAFSSSNLPTATARKNTFAWLAHITEVQ